MAWGSIGTACDMSASYRSLTTTSAPSMAASASPFTIVEREATLPSRTTSSEPSYDSQSGWMTGAPSATAASGWPIAGSTSYSTSISSTARAAISGDSAATAAITSPS